VVVLVAWPAGRAARRSRGLRRGDFDRRLRVALGLLYADLKDHGIDLPRSQTLEETATFLNHTLGLDAGDLVNHAQEALFGSRPATEADLAGVAAFRRELRRRLRARGGRVRALLALYGVPGAAPAKARAPAARARASAARA